MGLTGAPEGLSQRGRAGACTQRLQRRRCANQRPPMCQAAALRRCEDDLTHKLAEIIKANNRLKKQEENGAPQHIIREFSALLQFPRDHLLRQHQAGAARRTAARRPAHQVHQPAPQGVPVPHASERMLCCTGVLRG